ncbi:trimeric intracellular cation channel family protein [Canibacter zhoujuaniae]|uniref:trimeric intracellular cation channel family protein n=1 Tax=Canibacter zhoujuaniae TaxID=2708343 RepID=UPI00141E6F78|nr:TRIC cation channel family protein [Canibacter zhoujuaniae]
MENEIFTIPLALDISAVALGSMQGALFAAGFKRLDLLGVAVISICCGIGGGLIRDLFLNVTPATMTTNWYMVTCVVAGMIGMLLQRVLLKVDKLINVFDALSLGAFAALGTTKALAFGLPIVPAIFCGAVTAVGGGVVRDVFLNLPIAALHVGSFYAVAAIVGSTFVVLAIKFGMSITIAGVICVVLTAAIRLLAMRFGWSLPEQRALDRRRRRRQRQVEETIEAIRTRTIQIPHLPDGLPDIDPEGPNPMPRA